MDKKVLIGIVAAFILVLIGTIVYNNSQSNDLKKYGREDALEEENNRPEETIQAKYQYKDGEHIYVGTLVLPTPCHSYNAEVVKNDTETEIRITTAESGEACAQVITERLFKVSFEGSQDEFVIATLNGEIANLNIFEIPEDQDIDDIEIFNKG